MSPPAVVRSGPEGTGSSANGSGWGIRLGAIGLPLLALATGWALPRHRLASAALQCSAVVLPVGALLLAQAAGRGDDQPAGDDEGDDPADDPATTCVTVLVPARDEAHVIGGLIADLGAARSDPMEVVVVDDGSRDATSASAQAAFEAAGLADVARVVRLPVSSGSKGSALRAAASAATGDVFVVLDADARVATDFVARVRAATRSCRPSQARRHMLLPKLDGRSRSTARLLAMAQDGEQDVDDLIARARDRMGGASELRGDGMVLPASALTWLGGWPSGAVCEDLELSSRWYAATGTGVSRPCGIDVWEQPVLSIRPLLAQRLRWAEGSIRRDLRIVLPALADGSIPVRRRLEMAAYASLELLPWAAAGLAVRLRHPRARRGLVALGAGFGLADVVLALASDDAVAAAREQGLFAGRLTRAALVTAFTALWPLVIPAAWLRVVWRSATPSFAPTPHLEPSRFSAPAFGGPVSSPPRST